MATLPMKGYRRKPFPSLDDDKEGVKQFIVDEFQRLENTLTTHKQAVDVNTAENEIVKTSVSGFTASINANTAAITAEQTARASGDSALASDITSLTATVGSNTSAITAEQTARANADTSLASDITSLTSTVNGVSASVTTEASTRASADTALSSDITSLEAKYGVKLNVNGYITGFQQNNDGTTGSFKILADEFKVVNPSASSGQAGTEVFGISGNQVSMQNVKIGTAVIDDNAITIPSGAYATGLEWETAAYNSTSLSSWEIAQQVTFTGTGAPVALFWSFVAYIRAGSGSNVDYAKLFVRLTRNNSEIQHVGEVIHEESTSLHKEVVSGNFIDTTGHNGSVTYKLEVRRQGYYADVAHKSLTTLELKK